MILNSNKYDSERIFALFSRENLCYLREIFVLFSNKIIHLETLFIISRPLVDTDAYLNNACILLSFISLPLNNHQCQCWHLLFYHSTTFRFNDNIQYFIIYCISETMLILWHFMSHQKIFYKLTRIWVKLETKRQFKLIWNERNKVDIVLLVLTSKQLLFTS